MYKPLLYRMPTLFAIQRRASIDNTGRLFFPFFPNQASQLLLLIFPPPYPSFIQVKTAPACRAGDRACKASGRVSIAAIPARFGAS